MNGKRHTASIDLLLLLGQPLYSLKGQFLEPKGCNQNGDFHIEMERPSEAFENEFNALNDSRLSHMVSFKLSAILT
jgi:hypothetical protein